MRHLSYSYTDGVSTWNFYSDGEFDVLDKSGHPSLQQVCVKWRWKHKKRSFEYMAKDGRWFPFAEKINEGYQHYIARLITEETCEERSVRQGTEVLAGT